MKWVRRYGEGHVILEERGPADEVSGAPVVATACNRTFPIDDFAEVVEVSDVHERPFGGDTHDECHRIVKYWAASPGAMPDTVSAPSPVTAQAVRVKTARERAAAIHGEAPEPITMPAPSARRPRPVVTVPDGELPDDPANDPGAAVAIDGATFVAPPKTSRSSRRKEPLPEIDSD